MSDASSDPVPHTNGVVLPTELIHLTYEGNFMLECDATLLSCQVIDDQVELQLDRTTMHPQGGGQPTDVGVIQSGDTVVKVSKVTIDRASGIVTHTGTNISDDPSPPAPPLFVVGQAVHVGVDPDVRQILSECHTAGHVVDSAMARCNRILPPSKGYHFLDGPYVEYRGTIPPNERDQLLIDLQKAFADLVEEDIETKIETMSKHDANDLCNRVQDNFNLDDFGDGDIRIVTVAGWPCPCGGTHVRSTQDLKAQKWGITGIKTKKGVVRVKYDRNAAV
jgi:Ser-tRNA(Ala) deacylase AlaX